MRYLAFVLDKYNVTKSEVCNVTDELPDPDELPMVLNSRSGTLSEVLNKINKKKKNSVILPNAFLRPQD